MYLYNYTKRALKCLLWEPLPYIWSCICCFVRCNCLDAFGGCCPACARCPCGCCKRRCQRVEVVKWERDAVDPEDIRSCLTYAAYANETESITMLLSMGGPGTRVEDVEPFDVDHADTDGMTALMAAAKGGHDLNVPVFQQNDSSGLGPEGPGPFAVAWASENFEAVNLLLDNGAQIDRVDSDGRTALIHAATSGRAQMAELLMQRGAARDAQDKDGNTALMFAAFEGHEQVVAVLLTAGATLSLTNIEGKRAINFADMSVANAYRKVKKGETKLSKELVGLSKKVAPDDDWKNLFAINPETGKPLRGRLSETRYTQLYRLQEQRLRISETLQLKMHGKLRSGFKFAAREALGAMGKLGKGFRGGAADVTSGLPALGAGGNALTGFIGGGAMSDAIKAAKAEKADKERRASQAARNKRRQEMTRAERWWDGQWTEYTTKHTERIRMESKARLIRERAVKSGATKKMVRKVGEAAEEAGMFALLDKDGDGLVTVEEIVEGLGVTEKQARKLQKKFGKKAAKEAGGMTAQQIESTKAVKRFSELAALPENALAGAKAEAEEYRKGMIELAIQVELYPQMSKKEKLAKKLAEAEAERLRKEGEMYQLLDKDGDGSVTIEEIAVGLRVTEKEAAKILKRHGGKAAIDGGGMTADQVMNKKTDKALWKAKHKQERMDKKAAAKAAKAKKKALKAAGVEWESDEEDDEDDELQEEVLDAVEALLLAVEEHVEQEEKEAARLLSIENGEPQPEPEPEALTPAQLMLRELELREELEAIVGVTIRVVSNSSCVCTLHVVFS